MDLITMDDLSNDEITELLDTATRLLPAARGETYMPLLAGKLLGNLFFEPSTRTRMSFEAAMKRLGGEVINLSDVATSSVKKGETLYDTIRMVEGYADATVIRHPLQGAAQLAADASAKPVINAGDGAGHHPTQTLLDLYTIRQAHGRLDCRVAVVGDLRYGRTVHSLAHALERFGAEIVLVSPEQLTMPPEITDHLRAAGAHVEETQDLATAVKDVDVVYMTRIQRERFADVDEYRRVAGVFVLNAAMLSGAKEDMIVMHPLPRVDEVHPSVDATRHARYFEQAFNGVVARMALLCRLLGVDVPGGDAA